MCNLLLNISIKKTALACCALLLLFAVPGLADSIDEPDRELLLKGEVISETIRADESGGAARFMVYFETTPERVWETVLSCESALVFVRGIRECELLEQDAEQTVIRQVVKTSWLVPKQDFTYRMTWEDPHGARFERISGSPKVMEGGWAFREFGQGLLVTHELRVKPDLPVPRFLVRHLMQKSMPRMLACVRALSGGSLSSDMKIADRAACPE